MPDRFFYAAASFVVIFGIWSRIVEERAYRLLSKEEKLRCFDHFSKSRIIRIFAFGCAALFFFALSSSTDLWPFALPFLGLFFMLYMPVAWILLSRDLRALRLPDEFITMLRRARILSWLGICAYFLVITAGLFQNSYERFIDVDRCLDAGGRWNYELNRCDL